jgi:NAD(P)-dependent dehydrogenase (short-subunit alcohol dehydrogenase family)
MLENEVREGRAEDVDDAARQFVDAHFPNSLLGRPTTPEEVANLVVYLASEQAAGTNGAAMRVDGGVVPTIS